MPDDADTLTPADPRDLADAIGFALRTESFRSRFANRFRRKRFLPAERFSRNMQQGWHSQETCSASDWTATSNRMPSRLSR
jgi:hypothetical protein